MGDLAGRRALVTGGASGIGLATVRRFAQEGAAVTVVDLNEQAGRAAAGEVGGTFARCDVSRSAEVAEAFAAAEKAMGGLDLVYLNAGVSTGTAEIDELTDEEYRRVVGINVDGVVFGTREAVRAMKRAGGGTIVATASLAGIVAYPPDPIYGLTKHAVVGLVRALGPRVSDHGIAFEAVCPGIVETPLVGEENVRMLKESGFPLMRPDDVADAVMEAVTGAQSGGCWVVQPGRAPLRYEFRGVPGPRVEGAEGRVPPGIPR